MPSSTLQYWLRPVRIGYAVTLLSAAMFGLFHGSTSAQATPSEATKRDVGPVALDANQASESLPSLLGRVLPQDPQVRSTQALADAAEQRFKTAAPACMGPC